MVEKFKQLITKITQEKGEVYLFAVLKMDEFTDKWSIIISAPWIQQDTFKESYLYLRDAINNSFTADERATIARLGIFPKTEHIVEELLKYKEGANINGEQINGNFIHVGHLLASNSDI